ncbi:hypothetical protein B296_00013966 [Ensete ventricosum]|uniref:Uncharacterized protein n=1 Tax=Ensete ventricosum TaxID=4639 RepID=A0A426XSL3_ENSVE|nr:hypothetical protein B296_00013966 [Ensete ventricosum]
MHRVNVVGNSLGVRRELAKGIGSLLGWRKRVHQKKTETHRKIVRDNQKAYRDWLGDSLKGSGSSLGTRRKTHRKNAGGYRIGGTRYAAKAPCTRGGWLRPARRGDSRQRSRPLAARRPHERPALSDRARMSNQPTTGNANSGSDHPLAGQLPTSKGSRRLRRGSGNVVRVNEG